MSVIFKKMKSISNESDHCNNNKSIENNNWLGFSLSPNMTMGSPPSEAHHEPSSNHVSSCTTTTAMPANFFNLPPHFNYQNMYCGVVEGENGGGFYSALPVMPLKSDGSLCLMEAMSRSQTQG